MSLATFTRNAVEDFRSTAAFAPSSRHLAREMVRPWNGRAPRTVVEFGPGTGVMTRELLRLMPADGLLVAFEISSRFTAYLAETIRDERLQVVGAGAETARDELRRRGIDRIDGVVSSLGVGMMDGASLDAIFRPLLPALCEDAAFTQFQYVHRMRMHGGRLERFNASAFLQRYFRSVRSTRVWLNLPPAYVLTCRGARNGDAAHPGGNGRPAAGLAYTRS